MFRCYQGFLGFVSESLRYVEQNVTYVFLAAGGAITWKSKKQTMIALSSTKTEYVALSEAAQEACWL